jgi:hypothetical protein
MDADFVKYLSTLGIGGVLAAFMFMFYRKDVQQYTELWRITASQLMSVIQENTAANTKLIALIETQERNALRKEDLAILLNRRESEKNRGSD